MHGIGFTGDSSGLLAAFEVHLKTLERESQTTTETLITSIFCHSEL